MRLFDIVKEGGVIDMMSLAKRAKALLAKGMSEQQAQDALVKEGIPARLAAQAVQMAQMSETVADQLTQENQPSNTIEKLKAAFKGQSPVNDKVKYGDTAYPKDKKSQQSVKETPIAATDDPMDPMIYGHEKSNPMTLKGRILQTRKQLQELAQMAESNDLAIWMQITKLAKGGMFMGLEQNLEQVRHGLEELAAKRKKGGVASRGIEKFDENFDKFAYDEEDYFVIRTQTEKDEGLLKKAWTRVSQHDSVGDAQEAIAKLREKYPEKKFTYTMHSRKPDRVDEEGDVSGTTSSMVTVGVIHKNKAGKTPKNKDGTAKNALDMKANLLTGGSIAKR